MKAKEIREKYIEFFKNNNHKEIKGASLVPENDPTVLFTTAGMHPLVPYLNGSTNHISGNRLVDYQKCLRTGDIDEVGDSSHLTFFEMLGNWSIGDYFKEESIKMSLDFLVNHLNINIDKISVTCFEGDKDAPKDIEAYNIWKSLGIPEERIYYMPKSENWWGPAGETGPCGPDTEIFYDTGIEKCSENCNPSCDCGKYIEIWNNVFMQYNKDKQGDFKPLDKKCVDTGLGLERMAFILQGKSNVFETELFEDIISKISSLTEIKYEENPTSYRVIADHLRASVMLVLDKVLPSNMDQGYVLRRLIRRSIRHIRKLGIDMDNFKSIVEVVVDTASDMYEELNSVKDEIIAVIEKEKNRFMNTLIKGEKEFNKIVNNLKNNNISILDGENLFRLYDTYGFPPEVTEELALENGLKVDMVKFKELFKKHQELSRAGSDKKFKGGLADNSEATTNYHTAAHLLLAALREVLGDHVIQRGSNITAERVRFDFTHHEKVSREDLDKVEKLVNEQIDKKINVVCEEMPIEKAREIGAMGIFNNKYGDVVKVYKIGDFSLEICGGPHAENTGKLGKFKIVKEQSASAGVRRIKGICEKGDM